MRPRVTVAASLLLAAAGAVPWLSASLLGAPAAPTAETRQPRNIYELIYSFDHTFAKILNAEELALVRARSPDQIRQSNPELYERISLDVQAWTTQWIHHVRTSLVPIAEKRLNEARRASEQVDAVLRRHFEARGWPYRQMQVVFLPPRVFLDERHRENLTSGVFIPFFPDAFFVSVDWPVPMELVLAHETLHFNKTGPPYGLSLTEGITEIGARHLVLKYELLTLRAVRRAQAYPRECKAVELVLEEIIKRTSKSRDEAVDLFLETYLTGRQDGMTEVFGAETWKRIVMLSRSPGDWQAHRIKAVLEK